MMRLSGDFVAAYARVLDVLEVPCDFESNLDFIDALEDSITILTTGGFDD